MSEMTDWEYFTKLEMDDLRQELTEAALASCLCESCRGKLLSGARYAEGTCLHCEGERLEAVVVIAAKLAEAVLVAAAAWRDDKIGYYGRGYQGIMPAERALLAAVEGLGPEICTDPHRHSGD